jgi:hypothetical protein
VSKGIPDLAGVASRDYNTLLPLSSRSVQMKKKILFWMILFFFFVVVPLVAGEIVLRVFFKQKLAVETDERSLAYRYDRELGWFPIPGSDAKYTHDRTVSLHHNSRGFRDHEHGPKEKPRIVFLGDSFVWGYDAEEEERFTEQLQKLIPHWEVINLGVSGYGTDQEFLLLQKQFDYYKPEIVALIYCLDNDGIDNTANTIIFGDYFKPYVIVEKGRPVFHGIPVPKSLNYYTVEHPILFKSYLCRAVAKVFLRVVQRRIRVQDPTAVLLVAMKQFVESRGAAFVVGFEGRARGNPYRFCEEQNINYVRLENASVYPSAWGHWTPEGHRFVAQKIYDCLVQKNLLKPE